MGQNFLRISSQEGAREGRWFGESVRAFSLQLEEFGDPWYRNSRCKRQY